MSHQNHFYLNLTELAKVHYGEIWWIMDLRIIQWMTGLLCLDRKWIVIVPLLLQNLDPVGGQFKACLYNAIFLVQKQKLKMRFKNGALIFLVGFVSAQNYGFIKCTQGCIKKSKPNNILSLYQCQRLCQIRPGSKTD